jgi:hypothetical protein
MPMSSLLVTFHFSHYLSINDEGKELRKEFFVQEDKKF